MATLVLMVLAVSVASLVFMVKTWRMLREDRKRSGESLVIPRKEAKGAERESGSLEGALGMSEEQIARIAKAALAEQGGNS